MVDYRHFGASSLLKVSALAIRDTVAAFRGKQPVRVALAGTKGQPALMTARDVIDGHYALVPGEMVLADQVAARIGMRIPLYNPGRAARGLAIPALFCVCNEDSVAPAKATVRHVPKARGGQVNRYDTGHFDIHHGVWFERVVADQIEFLRVHVPV